MNHERMKWRIVIITVAMMSAATLALSASAGAYQMSGMGGQLGYTNPENLDGTATVSLHAELEQSGTRVHLMPNVAYWNVNRMRDLNPNLDLYYHFGPEGRPTPYLGGGLGLNFMHDERFDRGNTDLGMNLLGGVMFPGSPTSTHRYFVEGRFTASDVNQVAVMTGVTFKAP